MQTPLTVFVQKSDAGSVLLVQTPLTMFVQLRCTIACTDMHAHAANLHKLMSAEPYENTAHTKAVLHWKIQLTLRQSYIGKYSTH